MDHELIRSTISKLLLEFQVSLQSEQFNRVLVLATMMLNEKKHKAGDMPQSSKAWVAQWHGVTNWENTHALLSEIKKVDDLQDLVKNLTLLVEAVRHFSKNELSMFQKAFELIPAHSSVIVKEVTTLLNAYHKLKLTDEKLRSRSVSSDATDNESVLSEMESDAGIRHSPPLSHARVRPLEIYKLSDLQSLSAYFSNRTHEAEKKSPALALVKLYEHGMLNDLSYDVSAHRKIIEESADPVIAAEALIALYEQTDLFDEQNLQISQRVSVQNQRPSPTQEHFSFFKYFSNSAMTPRPASQARDTLIKTPKMINTPAYQVFANFNALMRHEQSDLLLQFFKGLHQDTLNNLFKGPTAQANYDAVRSSPAQYYAAIDQINDSGSLDLKVVTPKMK